MNADPADYVVNDGCPYCDNPDRWHLEEYPCREPEDT